MSDSKIQVINESPEGFTGIVIKGKAHIYFREIYQHLGLTRTHAWGRVEKLTKGIHYIEFTKEEIKELYLSVHKSWTLPHTTRYLFLTEEGYARFVMEISTGHMNNPEIAEAIDAMKDKMANIYSRYQFGEVISKAADETPLLEGELVVNPVSGDVEKLKIATSMNTIARRMGAPRRIINKVTLAWIKENVETDVTAFLSAIPDSDAVDNPPDDAVHTRQSVAQILKVPIEELESRLIQIGWVTRGQKGWHPTKKGSKFLKSDPQIGKKGFVRYDVKFGLEAIHYLKKEFEQQIFSSGYLSSGTCKGIMPVTGEEKARKRRFGSGI